jgi:hypothetical protein
VAQREYTGKPMDDSEPHVGSRSCYVHNKCRRKECRKANAEYKLAKTADHRTATQATNAALNAAGIPFADPKLTHGLPSTYEWRGCRCESCTEAEAKRQRNYRLIRELTRLADVG